MSLGAAQRQRLEHERRDVEIADLAAVGDLLDLHAAGARVAPVAIGFGLILRHPLEVRRAELRAESWSDETEDQESDGNVARPLPRARRGAGHSGADEHAPDPTPARLGSRRAGARVRATS